MRTLIGFSMIAAGVFLGLYVGLWVCFIGGVVAIVEAVKATPVDSMGIALGLLRVLFAGFCGGVSAMVLVVPGVGIASKS